MKTLFLVRHASRVGTIRPWPIGAGRSRRAANATWQPWVSVCRERHVRPDLIVSSPAVRALSTAKVIAKALDYKAKDIVVDARLYAATADVLIAVIEALDVTVDCVVLVGHNPEFSELAHHFSSEISGMPTCAVAEFEFKAKTWKGIGRTRPVSSAFDSPKNGST